MQWFAFDSHQEYTWALAQDETVKVLLDVHGASTNPLLASGTAGSASCSKSAP